MRVTDPSARVVVPTGRRSDASVVLEDGNKPVLAVVFEPQGRVEPAKWYAWPKYLADQHAELHCDSYLIVLALSRSVATWAREPIRSFQPGRGFTPYVIAPDDLPRIVSVDAARVQQPWLAALSALMHANDPDGEQDALHVLQATKEDAGPKEAWWLYELLRAIMTPEHCQRMQETIMLSPEAYLPKTDWERQQYNRGKTDGEIAGEAKGETKGRSQSILRVLAARQVEVSEADKQRILSERDLSVLDSWLDRSLTARTAADLF